MESPFHPHDWQIAHGRHLRLGPKGHLMAVINVTPDSFSDGGLHHSTDLALHHARRCIDEGAAIIDIGGESTKPNAVPVEAAQEQDRVLPVIEALVSQSGVIVSIDTYRAATARLAIEAGAHVINDVSGLRGDPEMANVAAETNAGLCIMHTGRGRQKQPDVIADQLDFLTQSVAIALEAGVDRTRIILDPGFGFAKETAEENYELMARFEQLHVLGLPLLAGTSRKRFLGAPTGRPAEERGAATAATTAVLRTMGAALFRVHDVAINRDALLVIDAMLEAKWNAAQRGAGA